MDSLNLYTFSNKRPKIPPPMIFVVECKFPIPFSFLPANFFYYE